MTQQNLLDVGVSNLLEAGSKTPWCRVEWCRRRARAQHHRAEDDVVVVEEDEERPGAAGDADEELPVIAVGWPVSDIEELPIQRTAAAVDAPATNARRRALAADASARATLPQGRDDSWLG